MESHQKTIGILREQKNKWERRCALTPIEVEKLIKKGIKVLVQPSTNRCYMNEEFEEVGAVIQEDMTSCDVIFGVKEVPIANLIADKTYFFFSHTIKAQEYNMELLDQMLAKNIRLVDYELIREAKEEQPQRLVAFGRYAGIAGAFDFLRGIGEFLLEKNLSTPFIFLGSTYMYEDYEAQKKALEGIAKNIAKTGVPKHYSPMVFAVTGTGRVSQGIIEVLEQLPHIKVKPDELKNLEGVDNKKIVISIFTGENLVRHKEGQPFSKSDYYAHPNNYESKFGEYLPYIHFLMNGIYWEAKYPRIISIDELRDQILASQSRLLGVCDISADYQGSVEFTTRFNSIENPFLIYDPIKEEFHEKISAATEHSILYHCVDHLPAEMPKEASNHFGEKLYPFVEQVVNSDPSVPADQATDLPIEIKNAIILSHGKLAERYEYIMELRQINAQLKQHQKDYMLKVTEAERKTSTLRRGLRFATWVLVGHLFDTKFFNICINILEQSKCEFRVIEWEVGKTNTETSSVTLQVFAQDSHDMDNAMDQVELEGSKYDINIYEGTGPDFESAVEKTIHEERSV